MTGWTPFRVAVTYYPLQRSGSCSSATTREGRSSSLALSSGCCCYLGKIFKHYRPTASGVRPAVRWEVNRAGGGIWTGCHERGLRWGGTDSESEGPTWRDWMCTETHSCSFSFCCLASDPNSRSKPSKETIRSRQDSEGAFSSKPPFRIRPGTSG